MKNTARTLLACAWLLGWAAGARAQVTLTSPADGDGLSSAPAFAWSGPSYDSFMFISVFYYDLGTWHGYYPVKFWLLDPGFPMPSTWWNWLGEGMPCYWAVLGFHTDTFQWAVSPASSFTKSSCDGQCYGGYTADCNPDVPCICFTTTEASGVCIDDFYCAGAQPCTSSAGCPAGKVCIACTNCGDGVCADHQCTNGMPHAAPRQGGGMTASGR
ncbi:MAG: hypothetical protein AB1640_23735 [bacterium]